MAFKQAIFLVAIVFGMATFALSADTSSVGYKDPSTIPLDKYVTITPDGHLQCEGKRVRYWGFIGHFEIGWTTRSYDLLPGDSPEVRAQKIAKKYRINDEFAQRIHNLGFNLVRYWANPACFESYTAGDGSVADVFAKSLESLDKRGIKLWITSIGTALGDVSPDDATIINEPATEKAWREAVTQKKLSVAHNIAYAWDPRLKAVMVKRMATVVQWRNLHKGGLRLGDDPQVAVWELTNEEWWFTHMTNGHWQDLPKFFRDELQDRWCAFLVRLYKNDAALANAWGFLLPGESLTNRSVALAPLASNIEVKNLSDGNPSVVAALTARKQPLSRDNFTRQRGSDVVRFFLEMNVSFKTAQRDAARTLGRGIGRVSIIFDTGENFRIGSLFVNQPSDASVMDTYLWQFAEDRQQPRFPFTSGLDEAPRTSMGPESWAESCRMPGKPFFAYETQTNNPSKYRAEFPFRILALATIQDWDIVCWHVFGGAADPDQPEPYTGAMNYSHLGSEVEGVHYRHDEVESASMKTAGRMFINGALAPVKKPTVMIFGRKSLYDPLSTDYGKSFGDLRTVINSTVYRYGCYMQVDTSRETDTVVGKTVYPGINQPCTIEPTDQITFDSRKGNLVMDAPSALSYTGFFASNGGPVTFRNGMILDNVVVVNPKGMPYPMANSEKYVSLGIVAEDGKPLKESAKITISLVSTSFNSGFSLNENNVADHRPYDSINCGGDVKGLPPVLVARVGASITASALTGMKYVLKDWHFKTLGEGLITDGILKIPADKAVFYVELTR